MESLQLHVSKYHEGARPFSCSHPGCSKTFSYKRSLIQHQVVHEPGYQKPAAKPRKRRSLASRLSGHPDIDETDFPGSPPHSFTFDPGKTKDPEGEANPSPGDTATVSRASTKKANCEIPERVETAPSTQSMELDTRKDASVEEETDLNAAAEMMLLAMQNSDMCESSQEAPGLSNCMECSPPQVTCERQEGGDDTSVWSLHEGKIASMECGDQGSGGGGGQVQSNKAVCDEDRHQEKEGERSISQSIVGSKSIIVRA